MAVRDETGEKHRAVTRIARQLGIGAESLRNWVNRPRWTPDAGRGTSSADAQRITELEREVRELRRANDILKAESLDSTGQRNREVGLLHRPGGCRWRRRATWDARRAHA